MHLIDINFTALAVDAGYRVACGTIVSPGKFEGEPTWVPYLWNEIILNGCEDGTHMDGDVQVSRVDLSPGEATHLGLDGEACVLMWEDDSGFVRWRSCKRVPSW